MLCIMIEVKVLPEPTPPITYDRMVLMTGNCLTEDAMMDEDDALVLPSFRYVQAFPL